MYLVLGKYQSRLDLAIASLWIQMSISNAMVLSSAINAIANYEIVVDLEYRLGLCPWGGYHADRGTEGTLGNYAQACITHGSLELALRSREYYTPSSEG